MVEVLLKDMPHPTRMSEDDIRRFAEAWRPYAVDDCPWAGPKSEEDFFAYFSQTVVSALAARDGRCYEIFAETKPNEDAPIGFVSCAPDGEAVEVDILVIDGRHQKRGFGRAALVALARAAQVEGAGFMTLQPLDSAVEFYAKLGFSLDHPYGVPRMSISLKDLLGVAEACG
ncbi:MAG: GNAT family N-acetyltransferase [Candidatus Saccharibacteria bacterium]|nr:GNAT family N-acetyltransferase [Candidatus Saccharibacteria bacterium]